MCGLLGYFNKSPGMSKEYRDWFESMLIVSTLRGWDGTGVAAFPIKGGTTFIYKKPVPGWDFVQSHVWNNLRSNHFDYDMMIGHTRAATHGKAIERHTHPFSEDNVVLTHNGVITNAYKLADAIVDSQAIALALNKEDDFVDILEKLDGSFALAWFDYRDQRLRLARNKERPLWLAFDEKKNGIVWASEKWMLEGVAGKVGLKLDSISEVPPNMVYEFAYDKEKLEEPTTVPFEDYVPKLLPKPIGNDYSPHTGKSTTYSSNIPDGLIRGDMVLFNITSVNLHKTGKYATIEADPVDPLDEFIVKSYNVKYDLVKDFSFEVDAYRVYCGIVDRGYTTVKDNIVVSNIIVESVREASDEDVKRATEERILSDSIRNDYVIGPRKMSIHRDTYSRFVQDGCSMCGKKLYRSDAGALIWTEDNRPICPSCVKDWTFNNKAVN